MLFAAISLPTLAQTAEPSLYVNQGLSFVNYSLEQGLSNKTVTAIHQDRDGFIWAGTMDGLNRFDGYTFTVFRADSIGNSYTAISYIHEDGAGTLWLSTLNRGLLRFEKRSGKFTDYRISSPNENERNACLGIFEDKQGKFWIPSRGGLNKFDPLTGHFLLYPNPTPGEFMYDLYQDRAGSFWCGTSKGLFRFDIHSEKFALFPLGAEEDTKAPGIQSLFIDRAATLWIGTERSGLFHLNPLSGQIAHYPFYKNGLAGNWIRKESIMEDASGIIWVGTDEGLHQLNPITGQFTAYRTSGTVTQGLKSHTIWSLYRDRSGLMWVGTSEGLHRLVTSSKPFYTYQFRPDPNFSRGKENSIGVLSVGRAGTLWLNNDSLGGLYSYDWISKNLTHYPPNPSDTNSLWDKYVPTVHEDHKGILWVLSGNYLHKRNPLSGKFIRYPTPFYSYLLAEDSAGRIWVGGVALARFDQDKGEFISYHHDPDNSHSIAKDPLTSLLISRSGTIWMGVHLIGLTKLEPKTGSFTHYRPDLNNPAGHLNERNVIDLYEDEAGILWIATYFGGLNRLDPKTGVFTAYTTRDGLPSNSIKSILGDTRGRLWLSTDYGISRFDPAAGSFRNYDHKDGLQDNEFYNAVRSKSHSGELLFGGPNGFTLFYPDSIGDNPLIPPVGITHFKVLDKARPVEPGGIELSYQENFLSFDFAALNYVRPEKNEYAYQLIGVDKDWVYSGKRRFANYTDLDPGSYTFRVKASNNDGVWNETGVSLPLLIHPPFWQTWWFIALSIAGVLGLLYGGGRYRISQIRKEEARKTAFNQKVSQLEMQALRAQMNPHFIFNCLNSINRFILKNQPEAASDYLSKFSRLIRLILQNSNTPTVTLENELEALELYLKMEALRFEGKFTFHIACNPGLEAEYIEIPPLIIQPYVENAIWHGLMHKEGKGHISIKVAQQGEMLTCCIEDDGIGRMRAAEFKSKSATKRKSLGMQITAHRLELLHSLYGKQTRVEVVDLVDAAAQACGTRVVVSLPIGE